MGRRLMEGSLYLIFSLVFFKKKEEVVQEYQEEEGKS